MVIFFSIKNLLLLHIIDIKRQKSQTTLNQIVYKTLSEPSQGKRKRKNYF